MQVSLLILALVCISNSGINAKPPSKIKGGYRTDITEAPYVVLIRRWFNTKHYKECGGCIINEKYILTAATCLLDSKDSPETFNTELLELIAGKTLYRSFYKNYRVEKFYIHPDYILNKSEIRANIAVIKVEGEILFNENRKSIELADEEPSHDAGSAFAWGPSDCDAQDSRTLQQIMMKVLDVKNCQKLNRFSSPARDELCATDIHQRGGICEEDIGSPLIVDYKLVGIASRTVFCTFSYFSNVVYYKSWIETAINGTADAIVYPANNASDIKPAHVHTELKKLI